MGDIPPVARSNRSDANMIFIPRDASDGQVIAIVRHWLDVLATEDYEAVFAALGYVMAYQYDCPGPEAIRRAIRSYRSPSLYPGMQEFKVTDWRTAAGGNPQPLQRITRYKPNTTRLSGAAELHLPLNGSWSNLEADFVWFDSGDNEGYRLGLEEIGSSAQDR